MSKFGATVVPGTHRVLIKIGGYNPFWSTFTSAGVKENVINALNSFGIGFESVQDVTPTSINPSYNEFIISVVAIDDQSDGQVKQLVLAAVSGVLTDITVEIVSGNAPADSGGLSDYLNSLIPSVPKIAGGAVGISTGVLIAIGIGAVYLLTRPVQISGSVRR